MVFDGLNKSISFFYHYPWKKDKRRQIKKIGNVNDDEDTTLFSLTDIHASSQFLKKNFMCMELANRMRVACISILQEIWEIIHY